MSLEQLKLSKPLVSTMSALGHLSAKEMQLKTMSRILGGQDIIAIGPEGSGKTTTYVLATLMRLKTGGGDAPRALILVPSKEKVLEVLEYFNQLNKNSTFNIVGIHADQSIDEQVEELTDGVDIVVAIPSRARAIYLKLGLNTNKIQMMVVDDAADMVKQGLQLPINELANSIQKCQHLVFTEVMHDRLDKMIADFMFMPTTIEVEELSETKVETYPQLIYQVPNFRTKLNLLNLLLKDTEVFDKVVVFVNTRLTAQTLSKDLFDGKAEDIFVYKPLFFDEAGFESLEAFKINEKARVLIVANENYDEASLTNIPFIIHFELPEDKMLYINRVIKKDEVDLVALNFITDLELPQLRKIEQAIGHKLEEAELPEDLKIEDVGKATKQKTKRAKELERQQAEEEAFREAAFQQKKESNAKTTNYSSGEKAKMNKLRNH
ncbi:DEAD/DEAH box helicase [Pedobacter chitinilyticus]|uniref:DEAD/DEAH box helicase n=1 Tax=Pedobacter chitinilyticus TaxID=2233776 RepID=A0A3S3Q0J2_9SPHI|nr:DEAD/DEAH box helicase [Pedobacter chitinilyticus]RWU10074.1 DEAD/DEAH box helicase [Pedobacter chitinilyticus]